MLSILLPVLFLLQSKPSLAHYSPLLLYSSSKEFLEETIFAICQDPISKINCGLNPLLQEEICEEMVHKNLKLWVHNVLSDKAFYASCFVNLRENASPMMVMFALFFHNYLFFEMPEGSEGEQEVNEYAKYFASGFCKEEEIFRNLELLKSEGKREGAAWEIIKKVQMVSRIAKEWKGEEWIARVQEGN